MRYCSVEGREQRRRAAQARWARTTDDDRTKQLGPARLGLMRRLMFEVDPEGELPFERRWRAALLERGERMSRLQGDPSHARSLERLSPSRPLTSGADWLF